MSRCRLPPSNFSRRCLSSKRWVESTWRENRQNHSKATRLQIRTFGTIKHAMNQGRFGIKEPGDKTRLTKQMLVRLCSHG